MEDTTDQQITKEIDAENEVVLSEDQTEKVEDKPKKVKKPMTEKQKEVRMANLQKALLKRKENKETKISEKEVSKLQREVAKREKIKKLDEKKEILKKELEEYEQKAKIDEVEVDTHCDRSSGTKKNKKKPKTPEISSEEEEESSSSDEEVIVRRKKTHKKKIPVYDEDEYVNLIQKTAQEKLKEKLNSERVKMAMMSLFN